MHIVCQNGPIPNGRLDHFPTGSTNVHMMGASQTIYTPDTEVIQLKIVPG